MVVAPGSGWPGDPATVRTPVAHTPAEAWSLAASARSQPVLDARVTVCRACPRLVAWREQVAVEKRRAFAGEVYWGRPVASFGARQPRILVLGLAPAAHGANRTGRMFTGDRSGEWLYAALYRVGLANQSTSVTAGDGLALCGVRISAPVRCVPPANKPTPHERDTCRAWLVRELQLVWPTVRSIVVLGAFGWTALWPALRGAGVVPVPARLPLFGHGAEAEVDGRTVVGCYHVSQQNTFTGRLTEPMLDAVLRRAADIAGLGAK
jgi:uracil-DNA glycosylase